VASAILPLNMISESTVVGETQRTGAALQRQVSKHFSRPWRVDTSLTFYPSAPMPPPRTWWLIFAAAREIAVLSSAHLREISLVAVLTTCLASGGCVTIGKTISSSGTNVTGSAFDKVKTGTSAAELRTILGAPNSITRYDAHAQLWSYTFKKHDDVSVVAVTPFIFGGNFQSDDIHTAQIIVRDGKVDDAYLDCPQVMRKMVEKK
jgi:outer membrane protein assembly factor BamE (lipoprotein component of BamABCDE complex)